MRGSENILHNQRDKSNAEFLAEMELPSLPADSHGPIGRSGVCKITADNGSGSYDVTECMWDDSASTWDLLSSPGGFVDEEALDFRSGTTGSVDDIVRFWTEVAEEGNTVLFIDVGVAGEPTLGSGLDKLGVWWVNYSAPVSKRYVSTDDWRGRLFFTKACILNNKTPLQWDTSTLNGTQDSTMTNIWVGKNYASDVTLANRSFGTQSVTIKLEGGTGKLFVILTEPVDSPTQAVFSVWATASFESTDDGIPHFNEELVVTGDDNSQLADWLDINGITGANSDNYKLYVNIVDDTGGFFHIDYYMDAAKQAGDLVAHTATYFATGTKALIEDNSSNVSGDAIVIAVTAADSDITAQWPIPD